MLISGSQFTLSADYYSARSDVVRERLRLNPADRDRPLGDRSQGRVDQRGNEPDGERGLRRSEAGAEAPPIGPVSAPWLGPGRFSPLLKQHRPPTATKRARRA